MSTRNQHRPLAALAAHLSSEHGIGMVSAMLALSLLAVFALVAAGLAMNERRSAFNEEVHTGAFLSADSGGEAAINWLRVRESAPPIQDFATLRVANPQETVLHGSQRYDYSISFVQWRPRAGYAVNTYRDFIYDVDSRGEAGTEGESNVGLTVSKMTRQGY
jgi:Tfp pilus assembly protein PilX